MNDLAAMLVRKSQQARNAHKTIEAENDLNNAAVQFNNFISE